MKKQKFNVAKIALVALGTLAFVSCKKDEDKAAPVASFTTSIEDKTVTFTNTSEGATSYEWNFGDESAISTETDPIHTFAAYGDYDVRLTAIGEGGQITLKQAITVNRDAGITIDGDVSDWASKEAAVSYSGGEGGFLTEMKLEWDATYLYMYLKGTPEFIAFVDIYIDADGDSLTGAATWLYPAGCGAEYLLEGDIAGGDFADLFADNPDNDGWCWTVDCSGAPVPVVARESGLVVTGGLNSGEIEIAIVKSMLTNLSTTNIGIGVNDYSKVISDGDWGYYGAVPQTGTPESVLYQWEF